MTRPPLEPLAAVVGLAAFFIEVIAAALRLIESEFKRYPTVVPDVVPTWLDEEADL